MFCDHRCLKLAHQGETAFNENTHKATAFRKKCKEIKKSVGVKLDVSHFDDSDDDDEDHVEICNGKQQVQLPFEVEEELYRGEFGTKQGYQVLAFDNDDKKLYEEFGEGTDFFILSVDCVKVEKEEKKKAREVMRKIKSLKNKFSLPDEEVVDTELGGEGS